MPSFRDQPSGPLARHPAAGAGYSKPRRLPLSVDEVPVDYEEFLAVRRDKERQTALGLHGWYGHNGVNVIAMHAAIYEVLYVNGHAVKFRRVTETEKPKKKQRAPDEES